MCANTHEKNNCILNLLLMPKYSVVALTKYKVAQKNSLAIYHYKGKKPSKQSVAVNIK